MQPAKRLQSRQRKAAVRSAAFVLSLLLTMPSALAANAPPSFTKGADQTVGEDPGAQTVTGWATSISPGEGESSQTVTFLVEHDNATLFSAQPAIAANGTLTYTPADNANGAATVTVVLMDDGGTDNGGDDTSDPQTFTITVNAVNDPPSFTKGADQTVNEDAGAKTVTGWATAINPGPGESSQTVEFLVSDDNPALFSARPAIAPDGTLTYTPADNANGAATVTVELKDNGGTANGGDDTSDPQTFSITVSTVNDPPQVTFGSPAPSPITDKQTSEPLKKIDLADSDDGEQLSATVKFPDGVGSFPVSAPGFTKAVSGSDVIYTLTARSVADAKSYLKALVFTPVQNRIPLGETETTVFTVTATDQSSASGSATVSLAVSPVNDAPRIVGSLPTSVNDNAVASIFSAVTVEDDDKVRVGGNVVSQSVTVNVTWSTDTGAGTMLLPSGTTFPITDTPAAATTKLQGVQFQPVANRQPVGQTESFALTLTVTDAAGLSAAQNGERTFSIASVNDAPTLSVSASPASFKDTQTVMPFRAVITDPDVGESFTLTLQPVSDPGFTYGVLEPASPSLGGDAAAVQNALRGVGYRPTPNKANNTAVTFQATVADAQGATASGTITLTIQSVNDPPNITGVTTEILRTTDDPNQPPVLPFRTVSVTDPDQGDPLKVAITLDDPGMGTLSQTTLSGTAAQVTAQIRAITFRPAQRPDRVLNATKTVTLTITVVDSGHTSRANSATRIAITSVNGAPLISGIPEDELQPVLLDPAPPVVPFAAVSIDDDDRAAITVTVSIDDKDKGAFDPAHLGGFVQQSGTGTYRFTGTPAEATLALAGLQFVVNPDHLFPPNSPGGTTFRIEAVDSVLNTARKNLSILLQEAPRNFLVTRAEDDEDPGSLRYAVSQADNNDVITFALPSYPALIRLNHQQGPLLLERNLTLKGPGADLLVISGDSDGNRQPDTQLFQVRAAVVIEGVTLTHGRNRLPSGADTSGGAIYVGLAGQLTLRACAVTESTSSLWGGAIDVDQGALAVENCLIRRNSTGAAQGLGGGAISLYTDQPCSFVNTTFSGNRQLSLNGFGGGALYIENLTPSSELPVQVAHCTFAENVDAAGRGSSIRANVFGTMVRVQNCIFADGCGKNLGVEGAGRIVSLSGNVSDDSTRVVLTQGGQPKEIFLLDAAEGDLTQTNPLLVLPLDARIRPTAAYRLQPSSPARGLAVYPSATTDQRGALRDDGDPDAGALETEASARIVINEIHFDPNPSPPADEPACDFVELHVPRDSVPVDLGGFSLWAGGGLRHLFPAGTVVQPGRGIIVADSSFSAGTVEYPTPVQTPSVSVAISRYEAASNPAQVVVVSPDHGLATGERIVIQGAPLSAYNGEQAITRLGQDKFSLDAPYRHAIADFASCNGGAAVQVTSPGHGLATLDRVTIADTITDYSGDHSVTRIDADTFSVPVAFTTNPAEKGSWTPASSGDQGAWIARLNLEQRGRIRLFDAGHNLVSSLAYVAEFVDPDGVLTPDNLAHSSISLTPDFVGFALLPHRVLGAALPGFVRFIDGKLDPNGEATSPGFDTHGTAFGSPNAKPTAGSDVWFVDEDLAADIPVLANDADADGLDQLVLVDVSATTEPGTGSASSVETLAQARVQVYPADTPLRGLGLIYDPRVSQALQALPAGEEAVEVFYYEIVDIGAGPVRQYKPTSPPQPNQTVVVSPGHRLASGAWIILSGALSDAGGSSPYNGTFSIEPVNDDEFIIPVAFADDPIVKGGWITRDPRQAGSRAEGDVTVTVIGANDPPAPGEDLVTTDEEGVVRIMGDPDLAGAAWAFDTDSEYPVKPVISAVSLLPNDDDPDSDDGPASLTLVGVAAGVQAILDFAPGDTAGTVKVHSPNHQLADGTVILISGYGGYRSYNGFHRAALLGDPDWFSIPVAYVDNADAKGEWAILNDVNRLTAVTAFGAAVRLELRADRIETSIVYNPRASAYLNGLALGESADDSFYYAVQDRHSAVSLARVTVRVAGVNDPPVPGPDPASLSQLDSLLRQQGLTLEELIAQLDLLYSLPAAAGSDPRAQTWVQFAPSGSSEPPVQLLLTGLWATDAATAITLAAADLKGNDSDVDRTDSWSVLSVASPSRGGAQITRSADGATLTYDPADSVRLRQLAREELYLDSFTVTVSDGQGGNVDSLAVVLVSGLNETPGALDDLAQTTEDQPLVFAPDPPADYPSVLKNDEDDDIDGFEPDNVLRLVPFTGARSSPGEAFVTTSGSSLTYDPTVSPILNALIEGAQYADTFTYTVMDGSFLFANDDFFRAAADSAAMELEVLRNDRNLTRTGRAVQAYRAAASPALTVVVAPAHGLATGAAVAIADCATAGLYNQVHHVTALDADTFSIPVPFVDDPAQKGLWVPLTITKVTAASSGGTIEINAAASALIYRPQVNFVGDETFAYTISDGQGGIDSGTVTVRVTVDHLNGNLQASPDQFSIAKGQSPVLDVLANDGIVPNASQNLAITGLFDTPSDDVVELVNGSIVYRQKAGEQPPYTRTFWYEISGGGPARAVAQASVRVVDRQNSLPIRNDAFSVAVGSRSNPLDVLANDNLLPGSTAGLAISSFSSPTHGQVTRGATDAQLLYTPDSGFSGTDTFTYVAADGVGGTGEAAVTVTVGRLIAARDFFAAPFDRASDPSDDARTSTLDVLANDGLLPPDGAVLSIGGVAPQTSTLGELRIADDGRSLVFDPAPGQLGEMTCTYTVQDGSGHEASAEVTIAVFAAGAKASPDFFTVLADSSANPLPVLLNDAFVPGPGRMLTVVEAGAGLDGPNHGGTVVVQPDALFYTPAPGYVGEETFTYTMTDSRSTDMARIVVQVSPGTLYANSDAFTVFFESSGAAELGREFSLPVLANDGVIPDRGQFLRITGVGIDDANAQNAPDKQGQVRISADGLSLLYAPMDQDFPYTERFTYEVSDGTSRRADAKVEVLVQQRANIRDLETHNDFFSVARDSAANILAVLGNDGVKPASADGWRITNVERPAFEGAAVVRGSAIWFTPQPGFVGTTTFRYQVSDGLGGTGSAAVTVKVGDHPLAPDLFAACSGSADNVLDVLANDALRPETADAYHLLDAGGADQGGAVSVRDGRLLYTPDEGYAGSYPYTERFEYRVADDSAGAAVGQAAVVVHRDGSDRASAVLHITVQGVNDPPVITGTSDQYAITDKDHVNPFAGVTITEVDAFGDQPLTIEIMIDNPEKGILDTRNTGFIQTAPGTYTFAGCTAASATAALHNLVFWPAENRITVPTTEVARFTLKVDDGYVAAPVTDTVTAVAVTAVNDPPIIQGTVAGLTVYHQLTIRPFAGVLVTEVDDLALQPLRITVAVSDPSHGYFTDLGSFVRTGPGDYVLETTTGADGTLALRGLVFVPTTDGRVVFQTSETTQFTITVDDHFQTPPVSDSLTTVIAMHGLIQKLMASDGSSFDEFGFAVSANRDLVAAGAPFDDPIASQSGSVYLFARQFGDPESWMQIQKIVPADAAKEDQFGCSVALEGGTLAAGARKDVHNGIKSGSVYVFERGQDGTEAWSQVQKLAPSNGTTDNEFGRAIALSGDFLAVGAPRPTRLNKRSGSVYLFARNPAPGPAWILVREIVPADGLAGDYFGWALSLSGDGLLVGAPLANAPATGSGAVYVFSRNQGGPNAWGQVQKLTPADTAAGDGFGSAVALSGSWLAVGAPYDADFGDRSGSAYLFSRTGTGATPWLQARKIQAADPARYDEFGCAVSLDDGLLLVGARLDDDSGSKSGSAYLFGQNCGGADAWGLVEKLAPPMLDAYYEFGSAVSIRDHTIAIGARHESETGKRFGACYIYRAKFNNPPMLATPIPDQWTLVNQSFTYALAPGTFGDPDVGDMLTLAATQDPASPPASWLSFNPETATFSGTPSAPADHTIIVEAADEDGAAASDSFQIRVLTSAPGGLAIAALAAPPLDLPARLDYPTLFLQEGPYGLWVDLTFRRRIDDPQLAYWIERSSDLATWASASADIVGQQSVAVNDRYEWVTVRVRTLPAAQSISFFRVAICP
ncbi:MAG TPA: Ig-like domain-containing protein [Candidatus Paceibacterota bacterium]|nr:Ig-like domain-containing protein [Verrucomicrobiota bacterium]HRZ44006.1 Ig-like domain-containing protein [Candidatus Paceibacterota bacterium]